MQIGIIYLLVEYGSSPERYKVGVTKGDPKKRLKSLQTGSSNELMLINTYTSIHYLKIEKYLHNLYDKYSTDGGTEWFQLPTEDVFKFTDECKRAEDIFSTLIDLGNPFI